MSMAEALSTRELLRHSVEEAIAVCEHILDERVMAAVEAATEATVRSLRAGGKVLLCGNGGSAADAQHLAAELVGRFYLDRQALPGIALADNISAVTAVGNDASYEDVYSRGVRALGRRGDVLIALSTSGNSPNVIKALESARDIGLTTIALVGRPNCAMARLATHVVCVEGDSTARIQEGHMIVGHTMFEFVERECSKPC